jgi:hypothetical protein
LYRHIFGLGRNLDRRARAMPTRNFEAIYFIREAPTVTIEDGMFHVAFDISEQSRFSIVMSPHTFLKMRRKSACVVAKFQTAEVVPVEFDSKFERVFGSSKDTKKSDSGQ